MRLKLKYITIPLTIDVKYCLCAIFNKSLGNHPMCIAQAQTIDVAFSDIEGIMPDVIKSLNFNEAIFYSVSNEDYEMLAVVGLQDNGTPENLIVYSEPKWRNLE